ncbi:MAG: helix-turn-helix transcriptional regulator [Pedobacter sp.]|nr:helix-turn-helix transcriptional regulator [Pedobacter sp.]
MMLESISETIKNRRQELKLTQPYLANMADVSVNTIFKIENGEANPTLEVLEKILEVLGMEIQLTIKDLNRI